jgi:hypothetical protein
MNLPVMVTHAIENEVLLLLIQVALILGLSRLMGILFARMRQPQVVGEMVAGIMLGPSVLGGICAHFHSNVQQMLFPPGPSMELLNILSQLGVIFFLFLIGYHKPVFSRSMLGGTVHRVLTQPLPVQLLVVETSDPVGTVIERAPDFDLVVIGVAEEWGLESQRFSLRRERIAIATPTSLLIVRQHSKSTLDDAAETSPTRAIELPAQPAGIS